MVFALEDEENKKNKELAGPSAPITPGAGPSVTTPVPSKATPQKPTQNFASLLSSNRGAIDRLGQAVGDYVGGKSRAAGEAISGAQQKFGSAVEQGTVGLDQSLINRILSNPAGITGQDEAAVLRQRDAQYKGPASLETTEFYSPAQTAVREAGEAGERTKTSEGRKDLLSQLRAKPVGQGVSAFDEAVLYGSSRNRENLAQRAEETKPFAGLLESASKSASERAAGAKTLTEATQTQTKGALDTSLGNLKTDLRSRLEAARDTASTRIANAQAEAKKLGGFTYRVVKDKRTGRQSLVETGSGKDGKERPLTEAQIARLGGNAQAIIDGIVRNKTGPGTKITPAGVTQWMFRPKTEDFSDQALADLGLSREVLNTLINPEDTINKYRSKGLQKGQVTNLIAQYFRALGDNSHYVSNLGRPEDFVRSLSPDAEINLANLAGGADYDRLQALNRLSGGQDLFLPTDRSQAGTAQLDLTAMDTGRLAELYREALVAAIRDSHRVREVNSRSGGDTWIKENGARLAGGVGGLPGLPQLGGVVLGPAADRVLDSPLGGPATDYAYEKLFGDGEPTAYPVRTPEEEEIERIRQGGA